MPGRVVKFFTSVKNHIVGFFTSGEERVNLILDPPETEFNLDLQEIRLNIDTSMIDLLSRIDNIIEVKPDLLINYNISSDRIIMERFARDANFQNMLNNIDQARFNYNDIIQLNRDSELHSLAASNNINDLERMRQLLEMRINSSNEQSPKMWDPNMQGNNGDTPLHRAIITRNLPAVKLLLDHGANVLIKNYSGIDPYIFLSAYANLVESYPITDQELVTKCLAKSRMVMHNNCVQELRDRGVFKGLENINFEVESPKIDDIELRMPSMTLKELSVTSLTRHHRAAR